MTCHVCYHRTEGVCPWCLRDLRTVKGQPPLPAPGPCLLDAWERWGWLSKPLPGERAA